MAKPFEIPSISKLAFQYGTITKEQYRQVLALKSGKTGRTEADLLQAQGMATRYQIGLLKLIRDYQIIRKKGEEFGKIAVEKGFASKADIKKALNVQKEEFRKTRLKKLIGDILVETRVLTRDQKQHILKEQALLEQAAGKLGNRHSDEETTDSDPDLIELSDYEKEFLKIKALDEDFSAAVLEKGLALKADLEEARNIQEEAFKTKNAIKILGDIMVDLEVISQEQKNLILKAQGRPVPGDDAPQLHVRISKDRMSAWVRVEKGGPDLGLGHIKEAVQGAGILTGMYPDTLLHAFLEKALTWFPVAKLDYSQDIREASNLTTSLDLDLTDRGEKRKGDALAVQNPAWQLGSKKNLLGESSKIVSDRDFTIRCGSGTRMSRDKTRIIAAKTGKPALSVDRHLYIHPITNVLEDADQRYGALEPYSDLTVAGIITGAYPVSAGHVRAREIRGATIEAIGDIRSEMGITDAVIRAEGDIHAKYLHNCAIETFGSVYVENEIFDSDIKCSGRIESPSCRVVTSRLWAKKGVVLAGTGSSKNLPCTITVGSEAHLVSQVERLTRNIQAIRESLEAVSQKADEESQQARTTFDKMVELKIFHDRAKRTKEALAAEFKKKKEDYTKDRLKNILSLIANFDKRMETSLSSLKDLNKKKKAHEAARKKWEEQLSKLRPKVDARIRNLEQTLFAYLEWARKQKNDPVLSIKTKAYPGSRIRGVYAQVVLDRETDAVEIRERVEEGMDPVMQVKKNQQRALLHE